MVVKLTAEILGALNTKDPAEALAKISGVLQENKNLKNNMSEQTITFEAIAKRLDAIDAKLSGFVSQADLTPAIKAAIQDAMPAILKDASAAASKITTEALASVSVTPAKPSPAPANPDANAAATALETAGKYEELYAILPAEQKAQFMGPKSFAAFMKAKKRGQVRITEK